MVELVHRATTWPKRLLDHAVTPYVPESVAIVLPGFLAAMSCGGVGASVTYLLPILRGAGRRPGPVDAA